MPSRRAISTERTPSAFIGRRHDRHEAARWRSIWLPTRIIGCSSRYCDGAVLNAARLHHHVRPGAARHREACGILHLMISAKQAAAPPGSEGTGRLARRLLTLWTNPLSHQRDGALSAQHRNDTWGATRRGIAGWRLTPMDREPIGTGYWRLPSHHLRGHRVRSPDP
jgi:hypothetical protein